MDNQQIAVFVPAANNADMRILWVKGQIAGLRLTPGNICAVGMLGIGSAAVANDIGSAGGVIKYPVHEAGTVQPIRPVGSRGLAPGCPYLR